MVKRRRFNSKTRASGRTSPVRSELRQYERENELVSARDRFKGALQHLLPGSEDGDGSGSASEEEDRWPKSERQSRKKAQEDRNEQDKGLQQQPFVMKLFDRSVDLAQFTENTPLYIICRAWMANQPHQLYNFSVPPPIRSTSPEIKQEPMSPPREEDLAKDTYWLPPPVGVAASNARIPTPIKRVTKFEKMYQICDNLHDMSRRYCKVKPKISAHQHDFFKDLVKGGDPPSKEDLLKDNREHWLKIRKSWHEASQKNEERYGRSLKTLVAIFNKAQTEDP